jgi:hypothetical protein
VVLLLAGCARGADANDPQTAFWKELRTLCGRAFAGTVTDVTALESALLGQPLVLHVRGCYAAEIRMPFHIGDDNSRRWILHRTDDGLSLEHDVRRPDGSPDPLGGYGGATHDSGTALRQTFLADAKTTDMSPASAGAFWTLEISPGATLAYSLVRPGGGGTFRAEFDLRTDVVRPLPPPGT